MKKLLPIMLIVLSFSTLAQNIGLATTGYKVIDIDTEETIRTSTVNSVFIINIKAELIHLTHAVGETSLIITDIQKETLENGYFKTVYACRGAGDAELIVVSYADGKDISSFVVYEVGTNQCTEFITQQIF